MVSPAWSPVIDTPRGSATLIKTATRHDGCERSQSNSLPNPDGAVPTVTTVEVLD